MCQLKGLTEFMLNELYLCHQIVITVKGTLNKMDRAKKMLLNYLENAKVFKFFFGKKSFRVICALDILQTISYCSSDVSDLILYIIQDNVI